MWFHSKIKYSIQDRNDKLKTVSEEFLHDAVTYGDVEEQLAKVLEGRVTDYEYDIKKAVFAYIYYPFATGAFYVVTVEEKSEGKGGVEKITAHKHLVVAQDVPGAEAKATDYMKGWVVDTDVVGAVKSKILGIWHPHNQDWKDDFKQRMQALAEEGNESPDSPQTTIFNPDGSVKKYGQDDDEEYSLKDVTVSVKNKDGSYKDVTETISATAKESFWWNRDDNDDDTADNDDQGAEGDISSSANGPDIGTVPTLYDQDGNRTSAFADQKPTAGFTLSRNGKGKPITFKDKNGDPISA